MSTERIAIYPGSFDPVTNGHIDILVRSLKMFDRVIVAIADNVRKKPLFTVAADFEYEFQFAHMNHRLAPEVDTIFLMTAAQYFYVSSSLVKEVAQFGGDVDWMVPPGIPVALRERLGVINPPKEDR